MTTVLLSPSETALAAKLGRDAITSDLPESKGADVLIYTKSGLLGIQRKEVPSDFISSFTDGRMARSLALLPVSCAFARVVGEGQFKYWPDGTVDLGMMKNRVRVPSRFTRKHIRGMEFDIEIVRGVIVDYTDDTDDTVLYIKQITDFLNAGKHIGLFSRPSAKGAWFVPSARDIDLWILQSFPGIGPSIADKIIEKFDGKIPMRWTCTLDDLIGIPGLGKKKAISMWESLQGELPKEVNEFDDLRNRLKGGNRE